jgi:hypothetical protein
MREERETSKSVGVTDGAGGRRQLSMDLCSYVADLAGKLAVSVLSDYSSTDEGIRMNYAHNRRHHRTNRMISCEH